MMDGKLAGKVALVTGASSGIGEATALALAAQGAHLVLVARRGDRLQALAEQIKQSGGQATPVVADLAGAEGARDVVQKAQQMLGRLDILVNSAGVMLLGSIESADTSDWQRMVQLNLLSLMGASQAALSQMKLQGSGHIVNISSVMGRTVWDGSAGYSATKWGVCAFSEVLRREGLKDNIRVTVIEPGAVDTDLHGHITDPAVRKQTEEYIRQIEPLQSEDIAVAIVYAVTQPRHVNVNEILLRPTKQEF